MKNKKGLLFTAMKGAVNRITGLIQADPLYPAKKDILLPQASFDLEKIEVENVCFSHQAQKQLLRDVSFDVRKGEMIVLLGERSSGKSSLVKLLQGEYTPEAGAIKVNGISLDKIAVSEWQRTVSQQEKIYSNTLSYNLTMSNRLTDIHRVIKFCTHYNFDRFFRILPQGYLTKLGPEINISFSQKKIIALARAVYCKPQLLLLDDFTTGMDSETEDFTLHLLHRLKSEMAIVFATQRTKPALHADRIYMFSKCL